LEFSSASAWFSQLGICRGNNAERRVFVEAKAHAAGTRKQVNDGVG